MIKIDEIVLSQDAPLSTRVAWAHPVEGDKIELLVYNNGEWCRTSSEEMDLSDYQLKVDEALQTDDKTIVGAINEVRASVDDIHAPYQIDIQALLSASDSESISVAIGTIQALNNVVSENRAIVGSVASGTVGVSIRILGNVTSLYYILDTVLGYTVNEINITNNSGVLSKQVVTHAFITENRVVNSLDSDETTLPLSAAQGKALQKVVDINKTDNYDISSIYPNGGIDRTNRYTLLDAVAKLPVPKRLGVEISFFNEDGFPETWRYVSDKTDITEENKWGRVDAAVMAMYAPTNNPRINRVVKRLYIDTSEYSGNLSLEGLYVKILARNVGGLWGIQIGNKNRETVASFWHNTEKETIEQTSYGLYCYAEYVWQNMNDAEQLRGESPESDLTFESVSPIYDPRRLYIRSSNINNGAITSVKIADGAVTKNKLGSDVNIVSCTTSLTGKLYGVIGDSITEGAALSDFLSDDDMFVPISGTKKATYGYYVAKVNNARWANYGISGSTLGDVTIRGESRNGFSRVNGRYTQLADDLDYLSIFFGWNDSAYGPQMKREEWLKDTYSMTIYWPSSEDQIGTVADDGTPYVTQEQYEACNAVTGSVGGVQYDNSGDYFKALYVGTANDTANTTFWGAWNVVLPYLINKYPTAKILLIVPYGCYELLKQCVRDAAKKYGLATYDFNDGNAQLFYDAPADYASGIVNGQSVKSFRRGALLADGVHPNEEGYKYMYPSINLKLLSL